LFSRVLCVGLVDRTDRRAHARSEFARVGIGGYRFVDGCAADSDEVRSAFESGRVAACPPCFRCGKQACECENRRLMPEQVGCWLAHERAWRDVAEQGMTLVCEDDVLFTPRVGEAFAFLAQHAQLARLIETGPVLLRLGRALTEDHQAGREFRLTDTIAMSNPCYALNRTMADLLLGASDRIFTTVDIFIHRDMAPKAASLTLDPPLASDLSWSTGQFRSDILPKRLYIERLTRRLQSLDRSDPEAKELERLLDLEEARFEAFRRYNREDVID
jgi:GR25 family glycosyltransferase involved in LPS biosynthesis